MSTAALGLALAAALTHAAWNLLLARERDPVAAAAVAVAAGELLLAPVALVRFDVDGGAWPYLVASAALELVYFVLLTSGYARGEMSVVYPLARGTAPVIVFLVGVGLLHEQAGPADAAGIALVAAGVLLVRGLRAPARSVSVAFGLLTACAIAGYTLVDDRGVEHADPATYLWLVLLPTALLMPFFVRGRLVPALTLRAPLVGAGGLAAYGLVLLALDREGAAPVAAVRETSVVFGVVLAAVVLHERVTKARLLGAAVVAAGVAALALG